MTHYKPRQPKWVIDKIITSSYGTDLVYYYCSKCYEHTSVRHRFDLPSECPKCKSEMKGVAE